MGGPEDHVEGGPNRDAVKGDAGSDVVQGGPGRDFCVATDDGVDGNDVANGGPGRGVYDADAGDVLVSVETARDCSIGTGIPRDDHLRLPSVGPAG